MYALVCPLSWVFLSRLSTDKHPESTKPMTRSLITLDDPVAAEVASTAAGHPSSKLSENFRRFGSARAGESNEIQTLTLRFTAADKLTRITSTKDFQIEPGGCVEGDVYEAKSTCTVVVRFTPQGPGHRFGKLTVADTASAAPLSIGLLGEGSGPVVSFTPAQITTVPGTFPSGAGLLSSALGLAVDGGDTLYIADTGNNAVRYVDSSGAMSTRLFRACSASPRRIPDYDGHCRVCVFHPPLHRRSSSARLWRSCDDI